MFNYQSVKVVSISQPTIENGPDGFGGVKKLTADEFVAYTARVSNPGNQMNTETAPRLIKYLIKHKHWSPFEMVHVAMEIKTTRDIGRQILRHRSFSFQEFSQRYAEASDFLSARETRFQDSKNRQNSIDMEEMLTGQDTMTPMIMDEEWQARQADLVAQISETYKWALERNIAKEQARAILPEGLTLSTIYMAGSLRSFYHYVVLRNHPHTQKEHRDIAEKIMNILGQSFPSIKESLEEDVQDNFK